MDQNYPHDGSRNAISIKVNRLILLIGVGALVVAIPLLYGMISGFLPNIDICAYGVAAKEVLHGEKLYRDIQEWKPPLATLAYMIPQFLAPGSLFGIQTVFGVFLIVEALIFVRLAKATIGTALCLLIFIGIYPLTFWDYCWPSTEHLSNLFVGIQLFLALQIVKDGRFSIGQCLTIGMAASLAFHFRQNAVVPIVIPILIIATTHASLLDKIKAFAFIFLGGLLVLLGVILLVMVIGDLRGYWLQVFVFPSKIAKLPANRWVSISLILSQPFVIMAVVLAAVACTTKAWRLVLISFPVGLAYCTISPKGHYHYWVNFFPFIALYIVIALELLDRRVTGVNFFPTTLVLAACLGPAIPSVADLARKNNIAVLQEVVEKVDSFSAGRTTLYVTGPVSSGYISFVSKLHSPTPIAFGWVIDQTLEEMTPIPEIIDLFIKSPPDIYVIHKDNLKAIGTLQPGIGTEEAPPSLIIGQRLLSEKTYIQRASVQDYTIFIRVR